MLYTCYIYRDPKLLTGPDRICYFRAESDRDAMARADVLLDRDRLESGLPGVETEITMEVHEITDTVYGDGSGCLQVRVVQDDN
jgi:hypothetical protein